MYKKILLLTFSLSCFSQQAKLFAQQAPTIQVCGSEQAVCIDSPFFEICVTINVDAGFTDPIDHFEINWGDGTPITIVSGNVIPPTDQMHMYDLSDFFATCAYLNDGFSVRLDTYLDNGTSVNSAFFPTFKNPPIVTMGNNPTSTCINEEICFDHIPCPAENLEIISWDFGDGSPPSTDPCHTYTTNGTYVVELNVQNDCGVATGLDTITIVLPSTAVVDILDGVVDVNVNTPYQVCLINDTAIVSLDGQILSENETMFSWAITPSTGSQWVIPEPYQSPNSPQIDILFTQEGMYEMTFTTNNLCNSPAITTLTFEVLGGGLSLNPQEDGCVSLGYTPSPLQDNAIYTINGMVTSIFPTTLDTGEYFIEVMGSSSVCQTQAVTDTFFVLQQETAQIATPDTTICSLDGDFAFTANLEIGEWRINGDLFNGTINPENYPAGTYQITYGLEPCITTDMVNFTIVKPNITTPNDQEVCLDDSPITFMASPSGGVFSGPGITGGGVFDPAITGVGIFTLYYEIIDTILPSCSNIDSFQLTVTQLTANFSVTSCANTMLCFDTINTSSFTSILWDFDGLSTSNQISPCFTFPTAQSYDVTVTIMNGPCTATFTNTISIEAPPVANFNLNYSNDLCAILSVSFENNSTGSNLNYEWLLNGIVFSTDETPIPQNLEALAVDTSFDITLNVSNDCATDSQTETLIVRPLPVTVLGSDQNQYCSGDTIPLSNVSYGDVDSYEWFLNGMLISTDSIEPIISYITEVTDTIEVCLVTSNSCDIDTLCLHLEITPTTVSAFFNTNPLRICVGDTVWFTSFATLGVPVFYDFGDNNSTATPNPFHIYQTAGSYLVVQQAFGCGFDSFEKMIEVYESPVASWVNPALGCPYDELFFENTSVNVMRYEWDFGDNTPLSEEESPTHFFTNFGLFEVCLTVFSDEVDGCSNTLCQMVEIFQPPTAGFIFTDSLCLQDLVEFTSTASNANMCDYLFGDDNGASICNPSHEFLIPGLHTVTQIVESPNFCKDTIVQQVFVRPLPIPDFSFQSMNDCHPDSVVFTNLSQNADSYLWDFGDNMTSTLTNPTHYYENHGNYIVSLTAFIDGICIDQITQLIVINETPEAIFVTNTPSSCAGLEVVFTNNSTGTFTHQTWDFGDGFFSFDHSPTHSFDNTGIYTVQLIVRNGELCADTFSVNIEIFDALDATFITTHLTCFEDQTGSINTTITSGMQPFQFSWSNGFIGESPTNLPAGEYQLILTDSNDCNLITNLVITQPEEIIAIDIDPVVIACYGDNSGALNILVSGGIPDYAYHWETGSSSPNLSNMPAGDYLVTITDAVGCTMPFNFNILQNADINIVDSVSHISCYGFGDGEILIDSIIGGSPIFNFTLEGPVDYQQTNRRFGELLQGDYELTLEDAEGCTKIYTYHITEPDSIFVNILLGDTITIPLGKEVSLVTNFNAANPTFLWLPNDSLSCADCYDPFAQPFHDITYEVILRDQNNCETRDTIKISVDRDAKVFIPNVFSPNNDGINDYVTPFTNQWIVEITNFEIFNEWGGLVFKKTNFSPNILHLGWDGEIDGRKAVSQVFVYIVEVELADGTFELHTGDVVLIR